jgi:hypothetical protein
MDRNSSLLKLKLDLVYRDLAIEEAQKRFDELNLPREEVVAAEPAEPAVVVLQKAATAKKTKVVRALVPDGQAVPAKRTMSEEARKAASERMKKRWADTKAVADAARLPPKAVLPAAK